MTFSSLVSSSMKFLIFCLLLFGFSFLVFVDVFVIFFLYMFWLFQFVQSRIEIKYKKKILLSDEISKLFEQISKSFEQIKDSFIQISNSSE